MTIGAALLLIAAGAVLRFAITTEVVGGVNLYIIGDILMAVGALGLVLWLVIWLPRTRRRRAAYEPPPDVPPPAREPYRPREGYPREGYPENRYPRGDGYPPSDHYPTEPYPQDQYPR